MRAIISDSISNRFSSWSAQYERDGVILISSALDERRMLLVEEAFRHSFDTPGPVAFPRPPASGPFLYQDNGNVNVWRSEPYLRLFRETDLGDICQGLFGSDRVWFFAEQLWWKEGGNVARTPWHQDASYWIFDGPDMAVFWIALDDVPESGALEFVRQSHGGPVYSPFGRLDESGAKVDSGFAGGDSLPPVPDVEAGRENLDIVSWPIKRGDLLIFHPRTLHGGAATTPNMRRRTLSLRFCGPQTVRVERPYYPNPDGEHYIFEEIRALPSGTPVCEAPSALLVWPEVRP